VIFEVYMHVDHHFIRVALHKTTNLGPVVQLFVLTLQKNIIHSSVIVYSSISKSTEIKNLFETDKYMSVNR
jgi:hypothetical protein